MAELEREIAVFETLRARLEAESFGKWALIHGEDLFGTFQSFEDAAGEAVGRFGRGPYLIRQIGSAPLVIPASAMFIFQHA